MSELPKGWVEVPLSEVADVIRGVTYKKEQAINSPKERFIPVLRATNITGASLTFGELVYVPFDRVSETQLLRAGDVIIASSSGSKEVVGKAGSFTDSSFVGSFGAFCTVLRPTVYLSAKYFGFYFQTPSYRKSVSGLSSGSNINNLKTSDLASQRFSFPAQAEQTRIVAKLEELLSDLDAGVTELKAAQEKLAQYRQSLLKAAVEGSLTAEWRAKHKPTETGAQLLERILQERRARWEAKQLAKFADQGKAPPKDLQKNYPEPVQLDTTDLPELPEGWVWASVEQVASDEKYSLAIGPFGSNLKVPDYRDSGVPLVFVRNIRSGNYGGEYTKYVTQEKAEELVAHSIQSGDVLVTKMGEPPGDADVYPQNQPPAIITADCIKIRCQSGLISAEFLKAVINSEIGKRQIRPITQGVAQKKVSLGRFSRLAVPLPPTDEQASIVQILNESEQEAAAQSKAIDLSLKQSAAQRQNILRAAFSGQLVPQNPDDEPASVLLARIRTERLIQKMQPKIRNSKKSKRMNSSDADSLSDWIKARNVDDFSFDDLRGDFSGDYEALKDLVFQLLAADQPTIEQFFDTAAGTLRFRKVMP